MKSILNKKIFLILIFLIQFISIFIFTNHTFAATTTISYTATATDIGGGAYTWTNVNNATGNTTATFARSTLTANGGLTNNLSLTNFNLAGAGLPTGATIDGITVNVEWMVSNRRVQNTKVQLTKDGINGIGNNNFIGGNGPTTKTTTTYGSATDLWGTTWTSADLLSSNFGVILQYKNTRNSTYTNNIYRVSIIVDYTTGTSNNTIDNIDFEIAGGYSVTSGTWTRTTTNPYEGAYSLESGNHTDNTESCFEVSKTTSNNSTISFFKEVSSESNYDFLNFYIDGILQNQWSGNVSWSKESYILTTGSHIFKWCYSKDVSVSSGTDTAWVDYIQIIQPGAPAGPGGIGNSLQLWLKADAGTSTTIDGNTVTTWNDQSTNGLNAGGGVSPTYINNDTGNLNFNPLVNFNGSQYLENLNNGAFSQSYFAVIVPDSDVNGSLGGQTPFAFDCNSATLNTGTCGLTFAGLTLGAFTAAINDEVITHAIGSSTGWRSAQIGTASYQAGKPMLINMNENSTGNGTEISEKGVMLDNYNANTYQTLSNADYRIGMSSDGANPFPYTGKIAEIINFNSRVSIIDKQKIESYLSLKYGITLNDGTQDYIASDGTTTYWSTINAGEYINDIFGIGRDDLSELGQVKSKSINDDNVITIEAIGEGTNKTPSFIDISDYEFLTIANNNLGNTWTSNDSPSGYFNLSRKWRVQEVGEVGTLNLDFNVGNTIFDIPNLSTGINYYFTYDSNNNNLLSDETPIAMTNISGNIWRIAGINLNNLREFTISTQSSTNNLPTNITLSNNNINENSIAGSTIGTLTTSDLDAGDTHTYSLVIGAGDSDNQYFNIVGNVLSLIHSPDYEIKQSYSVRIQTDDGNLGQFQKQFTININNLGETIPSSLDFENPLNSYKYTNTSGNWSRTTTNPYQGTYSFESNNLGLANTQSCFEMNNTLTQIGTISFFYNVSSQLNGDFLRFYIDNVEQQAWSGTVPWTQYQKTDVPAGSHIYKWCYIKDGTTNTGTDNAFIDFVAAQPTTSESNPPIISSINYASGTLLPGGNHNIIINYSDLESGINITSDIIELNKWNGSTWSSNISVTGFNLGSKTVTNTQATYPTNNLSFGKYKYTFWISDNDGNTSSTGAIFYIDEPELIVSNPNLDIGNLNVGEMKFSNNDLSITVKTVGAGFDLLLNKDTAMSQGSIEITDWNGIKGIGYDKIPYTSNINIINSNQVIATQTSNINTNGNKNVYNYSIKLGALIGEEQAAGNYSSNIRFGINLNY